VSRACSTVGLARSTFDYEGKKQESTELRTALKELTAKRPRWGLPRVHSRLRKDGLVVNHKRTARIYAEEKLQVRHRKRKKRSRLPKIERPKATRPNEVWSIDFVHDWLLTNRKLKCLTVIDDFTKESVGILVDHSISGARVAEFFKSLPMLPARIRSDNGPEFDSTAFTLFAEEVGIIHEFITPGKPN